MTNTKMTFLLAAMLLTLISVILSCSQGAPPASVDIDHGESGTWNWVSSYGGVSGDTVYADSVDYSKELSFDSLNNYVYIRDGQIESAGKYLISSVTSEGYDVPMWVIQYADSLLASDIIIRIDADTMQLAQDVVDGLRQTYAR